MLSSIRKILRLFLPVLFALGSLLQLRAFAGGTSPGLEQLSACAAAAASADEPALGVPAPEADALGADDSKIYYVNPWQMDLSQVPAPPAAGSAPDKEDFAALHRWQETRTETQCAAARAQETAGYEEFFGAVSPFTKPTPADAARFFDRVKTDAGAVAGVIKEKYRRPRPYDRDTTLSPCIAKEATPAYPSGHTTVARVFGLILSGLVPQQNRTFMASADQAGLNRVIGGVHHPSDVEEGKQLGDLIYRELLKSSKFSSDMNALRKYLAP